MGLAGQTIINYAIRTVIDRFFSIGLKQVSHILECSIII